MIANASSSFDAISLSATAFQPDRVSLRKAHAVRQNLEARVGAQRVQHRVCLNIDHYGQAIRKCFFQPGKSFILVVEADVNRCDTPRRNKLLLRWMLQLGDDFQSILAPA